MSKNYKENFVKNLIRLSKADDYADSIEEWSYRECETAPAYGAKCLCGHPVTKVHLLYNGNTEIEIKVGSCCIKKFQPLLEEVERSMQKVHETPSATVSRRTLKYAYRKGFITEKMYYDYIDIRYLRENMTPRRLQYKKDINHRMFVKWQVLKYQGKAV